MDWQHRGLVKTRRTKGTKFYNIRNYLALGIISAACLVAGVLNNTPFFKKSAEFTPEERISEKTALKQLKLSFPFSVIPRGKPPPED